MDRWHQLAATLLLRHGDAAAAQGHPVWFEIIEREAGAGVEPIELAQLDLLGWSAPAGCVALAVVATATIHRSEGPAEPPVPIPLGRTTGARLACVVGRDAEVGWMMRLPDGTEMTQAPEEGRLLDCLRRCLDLPTPPPPASPAALQSLAWLAAILEEGHRAGRRLTWRQVVALHPATADLDPSELTLVTERDLFDLIRSAGRTWTWTRLRLDTILNHWAGDAVPDRVAAWMDDGMFSRWILAELPEREDLIGQIRPYVAPATARRVAHAVRAAA